MILLHYEQHLVPHEVLQLELNCVIGEDILPEEKDWDMLSALVMNFLHNAKMDDRFLTYHVSEIVTHIQSNVARAGQHLICLTLSCQVGGFDVDLIKLETQDSKPIKSVLDIGK